MKMSTRGLKFLAAGTFCVILAALIAARSTFSGAAARARGSLQPQIVGPSVLLRLQSEGAVVLDLRSSGRPVPGAWRGAVDDLARHSAARRVVLLGDESKVEKIAPKLAARGDVGAIFYVLPWMLESRKLPDVAQLSPAQLHALLGRKNANVQVLDVSEADEFIESRVPGSRRVAYAAVQTGERPAPHNAAIVFT